MLRDRLISSLAEFGDFGFDGGEVGDGAGAVVRLGVLDDAIGIDDEGGAFGDAGLAEVFLGQEGVVGDVVGFGDAVVVVAEEGDFDVLFFSPGLLSEGVVAADGEDAGVEGGEVIEAAGDFAELFGADAGEGHGHEEKDGLLAGAEGDVFRAGGADGGEFEIGGFGADGECHRIV